MIRGINHITLSVRDLNQSLEFYTQILGCKLTAQWKKGAYLLAGDLWLCLLLDSQSRPGPLPENTHFAFHVDEKDFAALAEKIKAANTVIWQENTTEGDSLYFLDPNGHKLEIHVTTHQDRLNALKKSPYEAMVFFDEATSNNTQ